MTILGHELADRMTISAVAVHRYWAMSLQIRWRSPVEQTKSWEFWRRINKLGHRLADNVKIAYSQNHMQIRRRIHEEARYLWRSMTILGHELADNTYSLLIYSTSISPNRIGDLAQIGLRSFRLCV